MFSFAAGGNGSYLKQRIEVLHWLPIEGRFHQFINVTVFNSDLTLELPTGIEWWTPGLGIQ